MNKQRFTRPAMLLAVALAFAACSNEDILVDKPDLKPTEGKMQVSITAAMDDEGRGTRSSFIYGESLDEDGAAGESFQWEAKDQIDLRFSEQVPGDFIKNILSAPDNLKEGQISTTFSGEINKYTGTQTIYAVSPATLPGCSLCVVTEVNVNYPLTVIQKGEDLSHLGATDYMWARVEDFDLDADEENPLKGLNLNFEHLGAMLRFQIKNISEEKQYTLQSVTVKEEGTTKILWDNGSFNLADRTPTLEQTIGSRNSAKTVEVEEAKILSKDQTFDAYMMVPASPEGTDLSADDYRFIVEVVVKDEDDNLLHKEVRIEPKKDAAFMKNGFAAGLRYYYFIISVGDNLVDYYTEVNVANAGGLAEAISNAGFDKDKVERLKVTGNIDQRDFVFMKGIAKLYDLDLSEVTIDAHDEYPAHTIPEKAFQDKVSLRYITLPNNITAIGNWAFAYCSGLTGTLTIPESVETIGDYAFLYCSGFTGSPTIPASVETIGGYAFSSCSGLTGTLNIPDGVKVIGKSAFSSCYGFTGDLIISEGVETIGGYAFFYCSGFTGSLTIPASVTAIGDYAFYDTKFSKVNLYWDTDATILGYNFNWYLPNVSKTVPNGKKALYESEDKKWKNVVEREIK